jgi:hypothetical protein
MFFRNITNKSIILYQANGIKHVIPPKGKVNSIQFPEIRSSYDFEAVPDEVVEEIISEPVNVDNDVLKEIRALRGDIIVIESQFNSKIAEMEKIIDSIQTSILELQPKDEKSTSRTTKKEPPSKR